MVNHRDQHARCYCTSCRGATVTRKTFRRHTNRPQRYPGVNERICTGSRHPHGKIFHRATYDRHRRKDVDDGNSAAFSLETAGIHALLPDEADDEVQQLHLEHLNEIQHAQVVANLMNYDDEVIHPDEYDSPEEDSVESEVDEAELEQEDADAGRAYNHSTLPQDINKLVEWLYLLDGMTRGKRQEMIKYYLTHHGI